ncbi:hypothetical protein JCM6882_006922 [Rhodosporidiobolus microsporus]
MLRRLPSAASFSSLLSPKPAASPSSETPPAPTLPNSESNTSLGSPSLTEALSYDLVNSPRPDRIAAQEEDLKKALEDLQTAAPTDLDARLGALATVQLVLQHEERDLVEAFAKHGGFEIVVGALASLDGMGPPPEGQKQGEDGAEEQDDLRYHLATLIFHCLHLALSASLPCDAFSFSTLSSALDLSGLITPSSSVENKARTLSLLWAFLVGDFSEGASAILVARSRLAEAHEQDPTTSILAAVKRVALKRKQEVHFEEVVHPQVFSVLLSTLETHLRQDDVDEAQVRLLALVLLLGVLDAGVGERSLVRLCEAGLLRAALERWVPSNGGDDLGQKSGTETERALWKEIASAVMGRLGADGTNVKLLFDRVLEEDEVDSETLETILDAMRTSKNPPYVEFDLAATGSATLNLRSLGKAFPPPTHGYTFMAWISVSAPSTPTSSPLIIFGATDPSSKTFFELSLTPDLHFSLQTSLRAPPAVFSAATLRPGAFHHIALVHPRPKFVSTSSAYLYIDGVLAETVKTPYPAAPPKEWDVSAWLGTPSERAQATPSPSAMREGARWKLGSSWLIHGELPEEVVFICHQLGPRYTGNLQDTLGRFLTNSSAAAVNVRLDSLAPKPAASPPLSSSSSPAKSRSSSALASSPLIYALRHKASAIMPEHRLYFSLSAANVLSSSGGALDLVSNPRTLETLKLATAKGDALLNAAVPGKPDEMAVKLNGLAYVESATVAVPRGLDDALLAAGGLTLVLKWVEKAETEKELELAVAVFVDAVKDSWRMSEEAEERDAYEVLALHLRRKASLVTPSVHDSLLTLSGFDLFNPSRSIVANTLAVNHLLLDFVLWSTVDSAIQWAHFDRLRDLVQSADAKAYNLRKLEKLRVVRKLVFAVRSSYFEQAVTDEVIDLVLVILRESFSSESVRYVATYLSAALAEGQAHEPPSVFVLDASKPEHERYRAPLRLLRGLHDILLDPSCADAVPKFAKHVQTKWTLLLLQDHRTPPFAAVLALRILVRLLQARDSASFARFANRDSGFAILRSALPHLWHLAPVHIALFSLLHGHDISTVPLSAPFETSLFASSANAAIPAAADLVRVIVATVGRGLKVLEGRRGEVEKEGTRTEGKNPEEVKEGEEEQGSLQRGFAVLVELLAQAGKVVPPESDWPLLHVPVVLCDLVHVLRPSLHLPSVPQHPPTADLPPLPILSSAAGFDLPLRPPSTSANAPPLPPRASLKVQIPSAGTGDALAPSPATALETSVELPSAPPPDDGSITEAARLVLDLLAQQVTPGLTSRQTRQSAVPSTPLPNFASSDPALQPLRLILDSGASPDPRSQVAFRTLLIKEVLHRLARASTTPVVAGRVAALVEVATDFAIQGWLADTLPLFAFVLSYLEKLLDETALAAAPAHAGSLESLFTSLNRLILFSLSDPSSAAPVLELLGQHPLTAFAPNNDDGGKLHLLILRLVALIKEPTTAPSASHLFKLLALQRSADVEAAFQQEKEEDSDAPFSHRLLQAEDADLPALLSEHDDQLAQLKPLWTSFLEVETSRARLNVEHELSHMRDLAMSLKQKRDSQRRRLRRRRGSVSEWGARVHDGEATRAAHARQDIKETVERVQASWEKQSLQAQPQPAVGTADTRVALDFTEGPFRQRKKLKVESTAVSVKHDPAAKTAEPETPRAPAAEGVASPGHSPPSSPIVTQSPRVPAEEDKPATEPNEDEAAAADGAAEHDDEDKLRKITRLLEPRDEIEAFYNVSRVAGVDAFPVLLLVATSNIYLIDGLHQTEDGAIVNSWEAPESERDPHLQVLADLAGRNTRTRNLDKHACRSWAWRDLTEVHERRFLFRNCALELFFADGQSFLLTFGQSQQSALDDLALKSPEAVASGSAVFTGGTFGSRLSDALVGQRTKLERMTKRWEQRLISNFEYLTFLNTTAGRTYNDLTNYPVFPWVLADYTSEELDLDDPKTFRDLTKPMGAQTAERRREFAERFAQLEEMGSDPPPFHYGSHYSSAMTAAGYLVRLQPFTETYLDLQGGSFDHADRMFWSVEKAWLSASSQNRSDVRELTPEFFYLPDFLKNVNGLQLGTRQENDEPIDDVVLPPWAKGDPCLFVEKHRQALECEYVSTHLHAWVDLIFGYKQRGESAKEALNVFSHLSYEGAIDLDQIADADERKAATSTLHNFGMIPRQLFLRPHPARRARLVAKATRPIFAPDLPVEKAAPILIQTILPIVTLSPPQPICSITPPPSSSMPDRIRVEIPNVLWLPGEVGHSLQYGFADGSVRVLEKGASVPLVVYEGMHVGRISRAVFADGGTLVTASTDSTIGVWKLDLRPSPSSSSSSSAPSSRSSPTFTRLALLRGLHAAPICALAASKAYAVVVSGDVEGRAVLWDLNRLKPVRELEPASNERVQLVAVSDTTGDVATCSGSTLRVYTVNGVLLAEQSTGSVAQPVTAVEWSKSETAPILATGHGGGRVSLWKRVPSSSSATGWSLDLLTVLHLEDRLATAAAASSSTSTSTLSPSSALSHSSPSRPRRRSAPLSSTFASYSTTVTSLAFTARTLYVGTGGGKVHLFNPGGGTEVYTSEGAAGGCMECGARFSLLETRRRCAACAGLFCSLCTTTSPEAGGRFCSPCFSRLSPHMVVQ